MIRISVLALITSAAFASEEVIKSLKVPEGFIVESAAMPGLVDYPMFITFDPAGHLFVAESTGKDLSGKEMAAVPECLILRLDDTDGDGIFDARSVFADKLSLPMGVLWHQNALYVASPPDLLRFEDANGDGISDKREVLLTGWNVLNTASLHGPFLGPDGLLYVTHGRHGYSITTKEGAKLEGLAARIWRCAPDGSGLERFAGGGFDNPVELIFTPAGEMLGTMTYFTDPRHGQRDALLHYAWGGVYPKPHEAINEFVHTGDLMPVMTKFARVAPAGFLRYRSAAFGDDYQSNLFSAQFNPHRIMRHVLTRDGATFRTEDRDFLTSSYSDFYPTDLLEDPDGSMLFCDTGAWYVDACPISRIAKPEIKGGLYRVRAKDSPQLDDPRGAGIEWGSLSAREAATLLEDPRFSVRDRALELLAAKHEKAAAPLKRMLFESRSEEARIAALRLLARLDDDSAQPPILKALKDPALDVRVAAIQVLGDAHNAAALPSLVDRLENGGPAERREAASALGRIGESESSTALVNACANDVDRFEEHALIYALIELGGEAVLETALSSESPAIRRAAAISLDQMGSPRVTPDRLIALLRDDDPKLRQSALWIASRHGDWAQDIVAFAAERLRSPDLDARDAERLIDLLPSFAGSPDCQDLMAEYVSSPERPRDLRVRMLGALGSSPVSPLPPPWAELLGTLMDGTDAELRAGAIQLVVRKDLDGFDDQLQSIADDPNENSTLRIAALSALLGRHPDLNDTRAKFLVEQLGPGADPASRQSAARVLGAAQVPSGTKLRIAKTLLPAADALVMNAVMPLLTGESGSLLGAAALDGLRANPNLDRYLSPAQLNSVMASFPESVRAAAGTLGERLESRDQVLIDRFLRLEARLGAGDVTRGRHIFFGDRAACSTCHAVGDEGGRLGPDLTTIGLVRSGHDLLEAILFPSSSIVPEFTPYLARLKDDDVSGIIREETPRTILLATSAAELREVPRDQIVELTPSAVSIMPEGLDTGLSDDELLDLMSFLQSLNNEQWLLPERRS